jgi:hypothetical protein
MMLTASCGGIPKGGHSGFERTVTETVQTPEGPKVTVTTTKVEVAQPENPTSPANIVVDEKGNVKTDTGSAPDNAVALREVDLAKLPMFAGIALVVVGLVVGLFFAAMWGMIIGIVGVGMIIGSYLLAQYAAWFLLGFGVLIAAGIYFVRDYFKTKSGLNDVVTSVEVAKKAGIIDGEAFKKVAEQVQTKDTAIKVDQIKGS